MDGFGEEIVLPLEPLAVQPAPSHYTDYAVPYHTTTIIIIIIIIITARPNRSIYWKRNTQRLR